jgi:ubiquinone/menaquinone biosynthesis C-methylase UbiE
LSESAGAWSSSFAASTRDAMQVYDDVFLPGLFVPFARALVDRLPAAAGMKALDVATGPGTVARLLAERAGPSGSVTATDLSPAMLEIAKDKGPVPNGAPIEYLESPAAPIPVAPGFDVVTCQQGFQFFPDRPAALAEMRRVLRDGGTVAIATWTRIDKSPIFAGLHQSLADTLGDTIASTYLGPWSLGELDDLVALVSSSGLRIEGAERVRLPMIVAGGVAAALSTLAASGVAADVASLDDDDRRLLRACADRNLGPLLDGDMLRSEAETNLVVAAAG